MVNIMQKTAKQARKSLFCIFLFSDGNFVRVSSSSTVLALPYVS
ncbi:hypothetical protein J3R75_000854 [Oligosphaera ethanolica]|uniref:Uncharacterized protein n=1 Tax=Oligosphaera ethanolica TaxID=760260 RepID=A0AAE4ANV4_9BACT|nr:hypothetical protein [Oligosphaera ethanolica]